MDACSMPGSFLCCSVSIGWSVGATLGYSLAVAAEGKRLVSFIGDGSFQVTAQVREGSRESAEYRHCVVEIKETADR
jgi:TPP-dependent 2-oxoacid decarboxylase